MVRNVGSLIRKVYYLFLLPDFDHRIRSPICLLRFWYWYIYKHNEIGSTKFVYYLEHTGRLVLLVFL